MASQAHHALSHGLRATTKPKHRSKRNRTTPTRHHRCRRPATPTCRTATRTRPSLIPRRPSLQSDRRRRTRLLPGLPLCRHRHPRRTNGDKPFIFYPEYEDNALMPQAPLFAPSRCHPADADDAILVDSKRDYSQVLKPAAPGLLRGNPTPLYDIDFPMYDSPVVHLSPFHSHAGSHVQPGVVYASEQSSSLTELAGY